MTGVKKTGSDKPLTAPVEKVITSQLFEDYLNCPTKCFLRASHERGTANIYVNWHEAQTASYRSVATDKLITGFSPDDIVRDLAVSKPLKNPLWRLAINFAAHHQNLGANIHAVERKPPSSPDTVAPFIPIRFNFKIKLTRKDKLALAFDALVLSKTLGNPVDTGKIIHGDDHATKVDATKVTREVKKIVGKIEGILSATAPPKLMLNKHCAECLFQERCHKIATEKNDISLLSSISENEITKLNSKGIFSVTQLSYTFRPRRRSKRHADRPEKYHHALKALAIREQKIHIVGSPQLKIEGTPVFFDVEGLPDRDYYYLIGVRIKTLESVKHHSLWADDQIQEKNIWNDFIKIMTGIEKPILIHYGSYETTFLKKMRERYGGLPEDTPVVKSINSSINLLSVIYARVYFPTYSNSLKEIAKHLGFVWSDSASSGLQSLIWRHQWEQSRNPELREKLVRYNADDCEALNLTAETLRKFDKNISADSSQNASSEIVDVSSLTKAFDTKWTKFKSPISGLEQVNDAAYWNYQRDRVYARTSKIIKKTVVQSPVPRKVMGRAEMQVHWQDVHWYCPKCESVKRRKSSLAKRTVQDIIFGRDSLKRRRVEYAFQTYRCKKCGYVYGVDERYWSKKTKYGWNLVAYFVYNIAGLFIPQRTVYYGMNRLFKLDLSRSTMNNFKARACEYYSVTKRDTLARILQGDLIHVDETRANIKGKLAYVWVLTNLHEVVYILTENREGDFIQKLLVNFKGVLVTDFYSAYDSIECPQQKCLIHLMRDLNDDVLKNTFDEELKIIVTGFADLLQPIVETIDKRGLKKHFLRKHLKKVEQFYKTLAQSNFRSDTASKCKQRFEKNRDKLFTFLSYDGVPWNNNNAEHAIKAFAKLRDIISGSSTKSGVEEYLILLSISKTCEYQGIDFLDFLRSGMKDITEYANTRKTRGH